MRNRPPATGIRWLPNYVKAFGPVAGARLFWRVARLDRSDAPDAVPVAVPGLGTVLLRAGMRDHAIFQQVWVKREYDLAVAAPRQFPALMEAYRSSLAEGRTPLILDAGAHVGMSVLWWKTLFPEARVVAVEPSSANVAVLRRNLAQVPDVEILHAAVAGRADRLHIVDPAAGGSAIRVGREGSGEAIPAVTIRDIMTRAASEEILLAKIDIEGWEADLFEGDLDWLDHTRALAVETHDWLFPGQGTSRALFAAIGQRAFDFITSGENVLLFHH